MGIGSNVTEFNAEGIPFRSRARLFVEGFKLMQRLWSGESVTYSNEFWKLDGARMLPRPVQRPHPTVFFGGRAEGALRRAGTLADGWLAGTHISPQAYAESWQKIISYAESAGRDASKLKPAKLFYVHVGKRIDATKNKIARMLDDYYGTYDVENVLLGSREECCNRLFPFVDAGVKTLILAPLDPSTEQFEAIADGIMNRF